MKLKDYLTTYSIGQSKLSRILGVSQAHVSNILKGRKSPSIQLIKRIREATKGKVTADDLLNSEAPSRLKKKMKKE